VGTAEVLRGGPLAAHFRTTTPPHPMRLCSTGAAPSKLPAASLPITPEELQTPALHALIGSPVCSLAPRQSPPPPVAEHLCSTTMVPGLPPSPPPSLSPPPTPQPPLTLSPHLVSRYLVRRPAVPCRPRSPAVPAIACAPASGNSIRSVKPLWLARPRGRLVGRTQYAPLDSPLRLCPRSLPGTPSHS